MRAHPGVREQDKSSQRIDVYGDDVEIVSTAREDS